MSDIGNAIESAAKAMLFLVVLVTLGVGIPLALYLSHHLRWVP